jgi:hypothetical protein
MFRKIGLEMTALSAAALILLAAFFYDAANGFSTMILAGAL